jgi:hypothetical protein
MITTEQIKRMDEKIDVFYWTEDFFRFGGFIDKNNINIIQMHKQKPEKIKISFYGKKINDICLVSLHYGQFYRTK